jgi:hypothetical protein
LCGKVATGEENTKQFQILHATVPIADDKWGSYYIALKERVMMSEGEYSTFPYSISRYSTSPEEVFGFCCLATNGVNNILFSWLLFKTSVAVIRGVSTIISNKVNRNTSLIESSSFINESLSPMIERELDILIRKGKLPPIPEEVGSVYDVVFESPLNKMKDSDVLTGLVQVINTLLPMAADNPGLFDKINMDKAVEMALESVGDKSSEDITIFHFIKRTFKHYIIYRTNLFRYRW